MNYHPKIMHTYILLAEQVCLFAEITKRPGRKASRSGVFCVFCERNSRDWKENTK